jgi:hypothetical protein
MHHLYDTTAGPLDSEYERMMLATVQYLLHEIVTGRVPLIPKVHS